MDNEIKVSVVCLTYNHEKYIRKCLDGFVTQKTNFAFEVLVHDDASTDKTADIIREYEKKYPDIIKPIYQKVNQYSQHIPISKTYIYPKVKGKYIALCEGDDFWINENKLQVQFDAMEQHPDCVACFTKVLEGKENGEFSGEEYPPKGFEIQSGVLNQDTFAKILYSDFRYCFQTSCYFMKKRIIEATYNAEYRKYMNGDEAYLRTFLLAGNVYYISVETSCYRKFSIGSWTEKTLHESNEKKLKRCYEMYLGEDEFDRVTKYRFHLYIEYRKKSIRQEIIDLLSLSKDRSIIFKYKRELSISFSEIIINKTFKEKIYYYLFCYFPYVFSVIMKIRGKK